MDSSRRHAIAWRIIYFLIHGWICRKFRLQHENLEIEGPILLVPNHSCAWDPLLVAMSLPHKQVYFVASEHLFRMGLVSRILNYLVAPIPRRKASAGTDTAKACLRHLREGHSICLFAEGEQCWDGRSAPIFPATGKLARNSGATLVTFKLEGGYLSLPRWGKGVRRGRVYGHPVGIYPPDRLKSMTPGEINSAIERDLRENIWERQRMNPVPYRGRHRAEGMERALYACPNCRKIGTLHTQDDRIFCDCGLSLRYTETGFFESGTPFANIAEWDDWQKQLLCSRDFPRDGETLFSDSGLHLSRIGPNHEEEPLPGGQLSMYEDRLVCGGHSFPLAQTENMALVLSHLLLLSVNGIYYQIRAEGSVNLRKYWEFWKNRP